MFGARYQVQQQVGGDGTAPFGVGIARKLLVKARDCVHI
jgi:hypothetical protein